MFTKRIIIEALTANIFRLPNVNLMSSPPKKREWGFESCKYPYTVWRRQPHLSALHCRIKWGMAPPYSPYTGAVGRPHLILEMRSDGDAALNSKAENLNKTTPLPFWNLYWRSDSGDVESGLIKNWSLFCPILAVPAWVSCVFPILLIETGVSCVFDFPILLVGRNICPRGSRGCGPHRVGKVLQLCTYQEPIDNNSLFRSRDWSSANQGPVFPNSVLTVSVFGRDTTW
eukprot:sb/3469517/